MSSLEAAEMVKLVNNTYRDVTFAFANEMALIAEQMGLSAAELIGAANPDYPRASVPRPGFVGGPCLEKDALILIDGLRHRAFSPRVIAAARETAYAGRAEIAFDGAWSRGDIALAAAAGGALTLDHADFWAGNMIAGRRGPVYLDWEDSTVSLPYRYLK